MKIESRDIKKNSQFSQELSNIDQKGFYKVNSIELENIPIKN